MPNQQFTVEPGHPSLSGHFPGEPIVPGVLLLEYLLDQWKRQAAVRWPITLSRVKFLAPVRPGDRLESCIDTLKQPVGDIISARLRLLREGQTVVVATVKCEKA